MLPVLIAALMMMQVGPPTKTSFTTAPASGTMPIEAFYALTTGATQLCADGGGTARDCWLDEIIVSVTAASAQTVLLQNTGATWIVSNTNASFPAGGSSIFQVPGGLKFVGGATATAGANGSVLLYVRGVRLRGPNLTP